jgi:hypothetical protein
MQAMFDRERFAVSEQLSDVREIELGDHLEVRSPAGSLKLRSAGIVVDYSRRPGHPDDLPRAISRALARYE